RWRRQSTKGKRTHEIGNLTAVRKTQGSPDTDKMTNTRDYRRSSSHVSSSRPQLLHLTRRLRYRRWADPRRAVRSRWRTAARMDVQHSVVAGGGGGGRCPARC